MKSTNPRDVAYMFRNHVRELHRKAVPADPYYVKISIACGQVSPSALRVSHSETN